MSFFPIGYFGPTTVTGGGGSPLPPPSANPWADVYATDEDLAIVAPSDYQNLTQGWRSYTIAYGADGAMAAGSWVLTSATNNFYQQGVAKGHLVSLRPASGQLLGASELFYAVESSSTSQVWLRPVGQDYGAGVPPSLAGSLTGLKFECHTLLPLLEEASRQVDGRLSGIATAADYPDRFQRAAICWALCDLYTSKSRQVRGDEQSDWAVKARSYCQEKESLIASLMPGAAGKSGATRRPRVGRLAEDPTDDYPLHPFEHY